MKRRRPLLLFPCNGNAIEARDCLGDNWECIGFVDDTPTKQGNVIDGLTVFDRNAFDRWPETQVLAVPGSPASYGHRQAIIESLSLAIERYATVVHPRATISAGAGIGSNTLVMAGVVLTSNAMVGNHCCILPNTVVHHDSQIGEWSLIGSQVTVAGNVTIGRNCYIGSASSIMNGLTIGERSLIGFGSNVIRNVEPGSCVVGNPARVIHGSTIDINQ